MCDRSPSIDVMVSWKANVGPFTTTVNRSVASGMQWELGVGGYFRYRLGRGSSSHAQMGRLASTGRGWRGWIWAEYLYESGRTVPSDGRSSYVSGRYRRMAKARMVATSAIPVPKTNPIAPIPHMCSDLNNSTLLGSYLLDPDLLCQAKPPDYSLTDLRHSLKASSPVYRQAWPPSRRKISTCWGESSMSRLFAYP